MKPNENITTKWANVLFFVWLFQCFSIFSILKLMQLVCLVLEWQHVLNLKRLQSLLLLPESLEDVLRRLKEILMTFPGRHLDDVLRKDRRRRMQKIPFKP